jgi:predicted metalloprotease with PDZ domain
MIRTFLALLLVSLGALGAPRCDVHYQLAARWNDNPRRFDVTLTFDSGGRTTSHLRAADSWGGVANFEEALRNVRVIEPALSIQLETPKRWILRHLAEQRVVVTYQALSGVANVDDESPIDHRDMYRNQLGKSYFRAFGHGLFLLPEEATPPGTRFCIDFTNLPGHWDIISSLGADRDAKGATYATTEGHDAVRHSVFLGGDFRVVRRDIEGRPLYIAIRGQWSFEDAKFFDATASLIGAQRRFFNDFDYPHFVVSLTPNRVAQGSTGGTAVYNAFAMHASKDFTVPGRTFEYLIGHEHLHTWIPGRFGSQGSEMDEATHYWFSEGFTDYLTHRLLLTSGAWTLEDYAAGVNRAIERYLTSPVLSAPNTRIAKEFWSNREVGQLPYMRGELLALRWDAALRGNGTSMDAVLKSLIQPRGKWPYGQSSEPQQLAVTRLQVALAPRMGSELGSDMADYVERGEAIPIGANFLGPCFSRTVESKVRFELGFDSVGIASRRVLGVVPGSAAERAGLRNGMELINWSIHFGDTSQDVTMRVLDSNQWMDIRYRPVTEKAIDVPVFKARPGAAEQAACKAWLTG